MSMNVLLIAMIVMAMQHVLILKAVTFVLVTERSQETENIVQVSIGKNSRSSHRNSLGENIGAAYIHKVSFLG